MIPEQQQELIRRAVSLGSLVELIRALSITNAPAESLADGVANAAEDLEAIRAIIEEAQQ